MQFEVLGPVQARCGDGEPVGLGRRQRDILAALLVERRRPVSTDRLIEAVWRGDPPRSAEASLQSHMSRLRAALDAPAHGAHGIIETTPGGYRLSAEPGDVDADTFEALVAQARATTTPGRVVQLYDEALSLWRGPAFDGYAEEDFARPEAVRLEELRLAATEEHIDALLAGGRPAEALPSLEALICREPLRERPQGQLMVALYRRGRQAEALRVYQDYRRRLGEELGLEPSPQLAAIERDILQHRNDAIAQPEPPARRRAGSLPALRPTTFVGRDRDLAAIPALLRSVRLVTLVGPGGVGKTRLAEHVAHQLVPDFPGGVVFCDFTAATGDTLPQLVATALEASGRGDPADEVVDSLSGRAALLVLDNCEHVVDHVAELIQRLVREAPSATVLATSRERLSVPGEHVYVVRPLGTDPEGHNPPPAVELLVDRAAAATAGRPTRVELDVALDICRQLDGIPLAIELAAARAAVIHPVDLRRRLEQRFQLLTGGPRATPRHRTLRRVVEWSYDLLSPREACLFDRLGIFPATFTIEAAQRVCTGTPVTEAEISGLLAQLADRSLVTFIGEGAPTRYRLLETIRAYAQERLAHNGELEQWLDRHLQWSLDLAETSADAMHRPDHGDTVRTINAELDDLRNAHDWACRSGNIDAALRLVVALERYALQQLHGEVFAWAERSIQLAGARRHQLFAAAAGIAALGRGIHGDLAGSRRLATEALDTVDDPSDPRRILPLLALTDVSLYEGRLDEELALANEAFGLAETAGDLPHQVIATLHHVLAHTYRGEPEQALRFLDRLEELTEPLKGSGLACWSLYAEGEALLPIDPSAAEQRLDAAVTAALNAEDRFVEGVAFVSLTSLQVRTGAPTKALHSLDRAIRHWEDRADLTHQRVSVQLLVEVLIRVGRYRSAALLLSATTAARLAPPSLGGDKERDELWQMLRNHLDEEAIAEACEAGEAMTRHDVVSNALGQIAAALHEMERPPAVIGPSRAAG